MWIMWIMFKSSLSGSNPDAIEEAKQHRWTPGLSCPSLCPKNVRVDLILIKLLLQAFKT